MEFIAWRDAYNLGDNLIDAHHRTFFEMARDLVEMNQTNVQKLDVSEVLQFLTEYIAMHFNAEEQLMENIGYTQLAEHKVVHEAFTQRVVELTQQLQQDPSSITLKDLLSVAQKWFLEHILDEDMKIRDWIKSSKP